MHVTVIIPTYNMAELLVEAIASVRAQDHEDFELLVVDDGSTDDTAARVASIGDSRIRHLFKPNGGLSSARNWGVANARGDTVAFLDSDDLWIPNYLSAMAAALASGQHGVAYCSPRQVYFDGRVTEGYRRSTSVSGQITRDLFKISFVWTQATMIRREVLDGFFFDEALRTADDVDSFLRLSLRTQFVYVPDVCMIRRVRADSLSSLGSPDRLNCNKVRVLERFYYRLGGDRYITLAEARARIAWTYVSCAKAHLRLGARRAARTLCREALTHSPLTLRAAKVFLRACLPGRDSLPDWTMPPPLKDNILHR